MTNEQMDLIVKFFQYYYYWF